MTVSVKPFVDNPAVVAGMGPEDLGAVLLLALKREFVVFNREPTISEAASEYGMRGHPALDEAIKQALIEAWEWLAREGLIVQDLHPGQPHWMLSRRAREIRTVEDVETYRKAKLLPREKLHSKIADKVYPNFMRGAYSTAVFEAFREVEVAVRDVGGYSNADIGVKLMRKAFAPDGRLTDPNIEPAEQEATNALFVGAIGRFKNPHSHRNEALEDPVEAVEILMFASHLLRIVDAARERGEAGPLPAS